MLLALDNVDNMMDEQEYLQLQQFIGEVATTNLKVIFSSHYPQMSVFKGKFKCKKVRKLTRQESVKLFFDKIPFGNEDRQEFFSYANMCKLHEATVARFGEG